MNYQKNNNSFNKVTQSVADLVLAAKAAKIPQGLRELQLTQLYPQVETAFSPRSKTCFCYRYSGKCIFDARSPNAI